MDSSTEKTLESLNIFVDLKKLDSDFDDLEKKLSTINPKDSGKEENIEILKRYNKTQRIKELVEQFEKIEKQKSESHELLSDPDFKDLANEDLKKLDIELDVIVKELTKLCKVPLPNDDEKAIVEIRPGVGGVEASLFAEDLFKMYTRYFSNTGMKVEVFSMDYNSEGGINEAIFLVDEPDSFGLLRFESGVHRVQRVPRTESSGRIHTSSASVVVMPKFSKSTINVKSDELRIDVFRAGGPGGQSVNTTDSAVRIAHLPTGITVSCQNGKSQHKNKEMAMSILLNKLQQIEDEKKAASIQNLRESSIQSGDRSVKIRTYNFQQSRVTDHRINQSWFNLEEILNGEIEEVLTETNKTLRQLER